MLSDDGGIQVILQAIGGLERSMSAQALETNCRLGRMESGLAKAASRVERHSGEIESLKAENKARIDKKWVLVTALLGSATTLFASAINTFGKAQK